MGDIRWFAPNDFCALPVRALRAAGLRIARTGDAPAKLAFAASDSVARDGYRYARDRHCPLVVNIWDVKTWLLGTGRADPMLDLHGRLFPLPRLVGGYASRRRYYSRLNHIVHRAAAVWTPSQQSCAAVRDAFGVDAERVPFCFDTDQFHRGVGWRPPTRPLVLSISRLVDYKNHAAVLRAAALLPSRTPVRIVGRGPEAPRLRALAAQLGMTLLLDEAYLSTAEIVDAYRHASVVVCPSRFEGIGVTPLEAAAIGVPTIASDIPTHREFADGEVTLVPLDDDAAMAAAIDAALRVDRAPPTEPKHPFAELTIEACAARMLPRFEDLLRAT